MSALVTLQNETYRIQGVFCKVAKVAKALIWGG